MNRKLRYYTKRNLKQSFFERFFANLSVTGWLILINVVCFIIINIVLLINQDYIKYIALRPDFIFQGKYLWTLFMSMFAHVLFFHLIMNMLTLFFIGSFVEKLIGRKRFLWFYLISGLFAGIVAIIFSLLFGGPQGTMGFRFFGSPEMFVLGASGAIFGLAGLITILTPKIRVLVFLVIPMKIWGAMIFFLGFFWILSAFYNWPIGNTAHFGGFIAGVFYGLYLKNKYSGKVARLNRMIK